MKLNQKLKEYWHKLGSPRWFYQITTNWVTFFGASALLLLVTGLVWALAFAPADYQQGNSFRIMYVHVPAAMVAQSSIHRHGCRRIYWPGLAHEIDRCGHWRLSSARVWC